MLITCGKVAPQNFNCQLYFFVCLSQFFEWFCFLSERHEMLPILSTSVVQ